MSELLLLILGGRRWVERCGRLARECRYYLCQVSPGHKVREASSELLYPAPFVICTIPQHPTWWNSWRLLSPRSRERNYPSVVSLAGVHGPVEVASNILERDTFDISGDNGLQKKDRVTQASLCLQRLLGITAEQADLSVKKNQGFTVTDPADIPHNYEACLEAGFSEEAVGQNPEVLAHPRKILRAKIQLVSGMNITPIDDTIPFLKLGVSALGSFADRLKCEEMENKGVNRVTYLTDKLQCAQLAVCQTLAKHHFMRSLELPKLKQVLKIMLDAHVDKEDILNDAWAFRYKPTTIIERLERVTDAGVSPVKPWMIRCPELNLAKRIYKELGKRSVLGDKGTNLEYLTQRFGCDKREIMAFIEKNPEVANVSGPKIKRVVDFLLENEFTIEHVMKAPRVFFRSMKTLKDRLTELRDHGYKPKNLAVFCKSESQYKDFLENIKLKQILENPK